MPAYLPSKVQSSYVTLIRGKDTLTARAILMQTPKAASELMLKLLNSAVSNAENNHNLDPDNLFVSETFANPGPSRRG